MGVSMIVKKAFRPGGSGSAELKPGSPFVASTEAQAKLWRAIGFCEDAPPPAPEPVAFEPPKRTYTRKVVEAETPAEPAVETTPIEPTSDHPPRRRYQRRDMTAKTED